MKRTETDKVVIEPFALELPKVFDVQPDWTIDLPAKHKALIYKTKIWPYRAGDAKPEQIDGFRIRVVSGTGRLKDARTEVTTVLEVKFAIEEWVEQLSKTQRRRVVDENYED